MIKDNKDHKYEKAVILVATKCDLVCDDIEQIVQNRKDAMEWSKTCNIPYFETSAKDYVNIELLFERVVYKYWIQTQGMTNDWDTIYEDCNGK